MSEVSKADELRLVLGSLRLYQSQVQETLATDLVNLTPEEREAYERDAEQVEHLIEIYAAEAEMLGVEVKSDERHDS